MHSSGAFYTHQTNMSIIYACESSLVALPVHSVLRKSI